jgi:putative ABC transport system permease protein
MLEAGVPVDGRPDPGDRRRRGNIAKRNLSWDLLRFGLRNLGRRKARTVLTLLGIALGVATAVAVGVVRESAIRSLTDMFDQAAGRADLSVTDAMAGIVSGGGFDASVLEQVQAAQGVEATAPLLQVITLPTAQLSDWQYSFAFGNFTGAVLYGVDPAASRNMDHYRLTAGDDVEAADDAILLTESYAQELGLNLGDTLELAAPTGQAQFTLTGLLASEGLARLNRGQVGVTTLAVAQRHFQRPDCLDQIDVAAAPGVEADDLRANLETMLGAGFRVFHPASKGALVDQMLQTVIAGMGFISVLSLLVGGFLIYNTLAMTVAERTRELGLLRALGTSQGQVVGLVLGEAAALGVMGAGLGVLLGLSTASVLREMASATVSNELTGLIVLPQHVISGLVLGIVVALIAGLAPAWRAARLPVVETIQQRQHGDGHVSRRQVMVGLFLTVPGLLLMMVYIAQPAIARFELTYLLLVCLMLGVALLIPATIPPLERLAGAALGLLGVEGRLGGRNLARSPGRAALTAGALMLGLVSVIVIWAVVASGKNLGLEYTEKTLSADLWVYSPQPMPHSLGTEFETLPEVEIVGGGRPLPARLIPPDPEEPEVAIVFTAFDLRRAEKFELLFAPHGGTQEQAIARLAKGGAVLIASPLREWYGLDVGDTIRLRTLKGPADFEVAGVTLDMSASGYAVQSTWEDALRYFGTDEPTIYGVHVTPGYDPAEVGRRILARWGDTYNLRLETLADFRAHVAQESERMTALYNTMVLVGVAVAALGVANTLLMNVLERGREIGLLRSLGMTQGQVLRLVLAEAAALGALGGVIGIGLGVWLSYFAVIGSASMSGYEYPYVFPVEAIATCAAIALVVPLLAGLWPAWRGARANVVEAVRSE